MGAWKMEAAKARLSEVVRQAREAGPQTITVRGRDAAVVVSAEQYQRLTQAPSGKHWVDQLREGIEPFDFDFQSLRDPDTGRSISLFEDEPDSDSDR